MRRKSSFILKSLCVCYMLLGLTHEIRGQVVTDDAQPNYFFISTDEKDHIEEVKNASLNSQFFQKRPNLALSTLSEKLELEIVYDTFKDGQIFYNVLLSNRNNIAEPITARALRFQIGGEFAYFDASSIGV